MSDPNEPIWRNGGWITRKEYGQEPVAENTGSEWVVPELDGSRSVFRRGEKRPCQGSLSQQMADATTASQKRWAEDAARIDRLKAEGKYNHERDHYFSQTNREGRARKKGFLW